MNYTQVTVPKEVVPHPRIYGNQFQTSYTPVNITKIINKFFTLLSIQDPDRTKATSDRKAAAKKKRDAKRKKHQQRSKLDPRLKKMEWFVIEKGSDIVDESCQKFDLVYSRGGIGGDNGTDDEERLVSLKEKAQWM